MKNVVLTLLSRVYHFCLNAYEDLLTRPTHSESALPVHIINVDIKDNHEEALLGGQAILKLVEMLEASEIEEIDSQVDNILADWINGPGSRYPILHTVGWL